MSYKSSSRHNVFHISVDRCNRRATKVNQNHWIHSKRNPYQSNKVSDKWLFSYIFSMKRNNLCTPFKLKKKRFLLPCLLQFQRHANLDLEKILIALVDGKTPYRVSATINILRFNLRFDNFASRFEKITYPNDVMSRPRVLQRTTKSTNIGN